MSVLDGLSRLQSGSGSSSACVVCQATMSGARCDQCGAAVSPGGFQIDRLIAQTPHSRLYLASDETGRKVALKELLFALVPSYEQLEGFEREGEILKQLDHPQIPKLVKTFREGSGVHTRLYLAQEFVEGATLLDRMESHRFDEAEAKELARQVLQILVYLHGLSPRVLHRDIKPANLMRRSDGRLALVDFGSAKDLVRGVTHGATLVGTFGYMPPEQLGGTVDASSDLYALGATLIHLLTRTAPSDLFKAMRLDFEGELSASDGFKKWLTRMVEPDRARRFHSAQEALEALEASSRVVVRAAAVLPPRAASIALAGAVAGVLVVAGLTFAVFPRFPAAPQLATVNSVQLPGSPPRVASVTPVAPRPHRSSAGYRGPNDDAEVVQLEPVITPARAPEFLLTEDFTIATNIRVKSSRSRDNMVCTPESEVLISSVQLEAQPQGRGDPSLARLVVEATFFNNGPQSTCQITDAKLFDASGAAREEVVFGSYKPNTSKVTKLKFTVPRTSKTARIYLGRTPDAVLLLDLAGKKVELEP